LEVTRIIAAGDGSIGQLIGYHYVNSLTPELAGTPTQGVAYRRKVAQNNWFVADSVNPLDPGLTARKESGRFILNGSKSFSTGALIANSIVIAFPHNDKTYLTALPRETPGLRPNDDRDNICQRLTVSGTVTFDDVAVREEALIGSPIGPDSPPSPRATIFIPFVQAVSRIFISASPRARLTPLLATRASKAAPGLNPGSRQRPTIRSFRSSMANSSPS
jgi:hypothetical protein